MEQKQLERNSLLFFLLCMTFFAVVCFAALWDTIGTAKAYSSVAVLSSSAGETVITQTVAPEGINLNTATVDQLVALPGIGEVLAQRIVAYREEHGPFTSAEQLKEVKGIGEKKWEAIRPLVTV